VASSISLKPTLSPAITGVDPGTGEYMSKSDRIAQFKKTRISRDKVFGNNDTSSALAKITPTQPALPDAGGALANKPADSGSGGGRDVWKEISNIRKSVETLQETVKKISDSLLEQKKDKDDAEKKKKRTLLLAGEKEKAEKKEGLLEKMPEKMKNTLLAPVKAIGDAAGGILQKLQDFFMIIFGGFLMDKGLKAIQAFMEGDYLKFAGLVGTIIGSVAVVGGIMMAMNGALFALPGLIASVASALATVGAAIIGFLLSPVGLITLAVIAGIGAAVLGANAIRTAMAGGKEFREAHKKNNEKLKNMDAMGVSSGGKIKVDGKDVDVMEHGTDEQKAAYMDFKAEKDRLNGIRDGMNDEIDKKKKEFFDNIRKTSPPRGTTARTLYWKEARVEWEEKQQGIRDKWEAKITGGAAPAAPKTDAKIDGKSSAEVSTSEGKDPEISGVKPPTTPGPVGDPKPNVVVKKPTQKGGGPTMPTGQGQSTQVPAIASSNPSNFYTLYAKINYNLVN
tara:strand:+ start:190 stop:1713 length:1524 start_codon:yes stop_codon:yes gene_type:complete